MKKFIYAFEIISDEDIPEIVEIFDSKEKAVKRAIEFISDLKTRKKVLWKEVIESRNHKDFKDKYTIKEWEIVYEPVKVYTYIHSISIIEFELNKKYEDKFK